VLIEEKRANPSNYALVVLSEGAEWEGYEMHEYGEPDAYGHRKKASVAESLADEIKRRTCPSSKLRKPKKSWSFSGIQSFEYHQQPPLGVVLCH
jgi:hypothetical protein